MIVCTVATHSDRYFPSLVDSCKRHHCKLVVLGWGQKWQGLQWKFQLLQEYLQSLDDKEIVLFVDAFDVIILRSCEQIESTFRDMNVPFVFSTELDHPNVFIRSAMGKIFKKCQGYNVNTGLYMGYAGALLDFFGRMCNEVDCADASNNDQQLLCDFCDQKPKELNLDVEGRLFLNVFGGTSLMPSTRIDMAKNKYFRMVDGRVLNVSNQLEPCVLHGPGDTNLDDVVRALDLKPGKAGSTLEYYKHNIKHYTPLFLRRIMWMLVWAIFLMIVIVLLCFYLHRRHNRTSSLASTESTTRNRLDDRSVNVES